MKLPSTQRPTAGTDDTTIFGHRFATDEFFFIPDGWTFLGGQQDNLPLDADTRLATSKQLIKNIATTDQPYKLAVPIHVYIP